MDERGLVPFLEAIYALDLDDDTWLAQTLSAMAELWGAEHYYAGYFYDASDLSDFKVWNVHATDTSPCMVEAFRLWREALTPEYIGATLRRLHVGSVRGKSSPQLDAVLDELVRGGWGDVYNINGLDPSGIGCMLGIGTREYEVSPDAREVATYTRLANHLAAAFRCRRRLGVSAADRPVHRKPDAGTTGAEAILDTRGRFVHADGAAAGETARERIAAAASAIDTLRSKRRLEGGAALDSWHPLTASRWTLVDSFEESGRRYIVARENQLQASGVEALTNRERQVVLHAALGLTNKEIAYTLDISDVTVRVLMSRAAARLGVRSRGELLAHPAVREMQNSAGKD